MVPKCTNGWKKTKGSDITYHRVGQVVQLKAFGCEISGGTTRES